MDDFSIVVSQSSKSHRVATFQSINPSIFFYSPFEMVSSVLIVTRLPLPSSEYISSVLLYQRILFADCLYV